MYLVLTLYPASFLNKYLLIYRYKKWHPKMFGKMPINESLAVTIASGNISQWEAHITYRK